MNQIKWEQECAERGSARYYANQDRLRKNNASTTDSRDFILKDRLDDLSEDIQLRITTNVGHKAKYRKLLDSAIDGDVGKACFMTLKILLDEVAMGKTVKLANMASRLGTAMEVEHKIKCFHDLYPAYVDTVLKSFVEKGVTSTTHKRKTLMKKFGDFDIQWTDWGVNTQVHVASILIKAMLKVMSDLVFIKRIFRNGKKLWIIDTTVEFDDWIAEFERERGLLYPMYLPLKEKPLDWHKGDTRGAYHTVALSIPFVKARGPEAKAFIEKHDPEAHREAVNKLQSTQWCINKRVLDVQKEVFRRDLRIGVPPAQPVEMVPFPAHLNTTPKELYSDLDKEEVTNWKALSKRLYAKEQQRKGKVISFRQSHLLALELEEWEKFHFAYNCDFRGRIYCATSGLSPQGTDSSKGLLSFTRGVTVGTSGIRWLAIHGANVFGEDKKSFDDRVKWIRDNEDLIRAIVEDPIANTQWSEADKPYQFLAFCFEWHDTNYGTNPKAVGHIPVGLDGSCNGLQHFSAMLRDEVGAKATNLTNNTTPHDIYAEVARVCYEKLADIDDPRARVWERVGVNRTMAKRPVMTLPYGATQQSARNYIYEEVIGSWHLFDMDESHQWDMAKFLTPVLWSSISDVVIAARGAMDWLRKNIRRDFNMWVTPLGFPVYQHYKEHKTLQIRTSIHGSLRLYLSDPKAEIGCKLSAQRNGVSPNFIHSIDATHMVMTILGSECSDYAMIHDDFGTHAGNTEHLSKVIREQFHKLYSEHNPLQEWADQTGDCKELPPLGTYDIEEVIKADYFFG